MIQEDVPEVTVDTTEDRQSHVESDAEDRDIADNDWMPISITDGNDMTSDRHNVVGDRQFRNTRTKDVLQQSSTTAAAQVRFLKKSSMSYLFYKIMEIVFDVCITTIQHAGSLLL